MIKKKKWGVFFVTASVTSLVFLDTSVMPVALPTIQKQFHFGDINLIWVVNIYLLSLTSLLLIGGRLSDLFGKRFLFGWGLSLFGIGSILCGLSFTKWSLLLGRAIQGAGGALTFPATAALLTATFPEGERARAFGINTSISAIFLLLGPALGGLFTQYLSWRWIFALNLPLIIFGLIMTFIIVEKEPKKKETFHFSGASILVLGAVGLIIALMQGNIWGWNSPVTLSFLVVSPILFYLFYRVSRKTPYPLIDFRFFKNTLFSIATGCIFLVQTIVMVTVLWAIYFQRHFHYTPVQTGLIIFIAVLPVFLIAPFGGYLADRFTPRLPMTLGFGLLTFSLLWLLLTAHGESVLLLLPGLLTFGCSISMIMSPTIAMALSQVSAEKLGAASGIATGARQLASTFGIALLTAIFHFALSVTASPEKAFEAISFISMCFAILGFFIVFFGVRPNAQKT